MHSQHISLILQLQPLVTMLYNINIKASFLKLLLSKFLFYLLLIVSLMGMMNPPGPGTYHQTFNWLTNLYNNRNQAAQDLLIGYNASIRDCYAAMRNVAISANNSVLNYRNLSLDDLNRTRLISDRISSISGAVDSFASDAKYRARGIESGTPNIVPLGNDAAILGALEQIKNLEQQAQHALGEAEDAANKAAGYIPEIVGKINEINQIVNEMINQINQGQELAIFGVGYGQGELDVCNHILTRVPTLVRQANKLALQAKNESERAHNSFNQINNFVLQVHQLGLNIGAPVNNM